MILVARKLDANKMFPKLRVTENISIDLQTIIFAVIVANVIHTISPSFFKYL